jgi:hypothetical protein
MVIHAYKLSTERPEAGELLVPGQPGLLSEIPSQKSTRLK